MLERNERASLDALLVFQPCTTSCFSDSGRCQTCLFLCPVDFAAVDRSAARLCFDLAGLAGLAGLVALAANRTVVTYPFGTDP